ncbi:thymidine kinase [Clostridium sp.]|uniref:thymidine kinase n=1 Tax=Clostridium sp. TaxID=1506 RepID=UPI002FC94E0A
MGKLYYYHGTMASAKSATLLMKAHQFETTGEKCILLKPSFDTRTHGTIKSRIGLEKECALIAQGDNLYQVIGNYVRLYGYRYVFIDEVQFLTKEQIFQLWRLTRNRSFNISIFAFGLKTDYMNRLFGASSELLVMADDVHELKSMCKFCSKKATTHLRVVDGVVIKSGEQNIVGDNIGEERYISVCQDCFHEPPKFL